MTELISGQLTVTITPYLVLISHGNLAGIVGDVHTGDLDIVMADPGDDLDPVEVVGEDDDVAAGSVGYEGDPLH